jgi:HEAT repeat protein
MCWRNSHSKVRYKFSDLNDTEVLVAEFQESIRPAIPQFITLLSDGELDVREAGVGALVKLSEQSKVSKICSELC